MTERQLTVNVDVFLKAIKPRVYLVIFGAGLDVLPLVSLAKNLGWHTSVVDTRGSVSSIERFQEADAVCLCRPEDVSTQIMVSERTAVVVMTDDSLHAQELLGQLLPLPLRYLWCFGSGLRRETPEEIALSIVSEIKAGLSEGLIHNWSLPAFSPLGAFAAENYVR
jgi:xanthine dehydrogenase accessory factor